MHKEEKLVKIPDFIRRWYQKLGVSKLPTFLKPSFVVPLYQLPDWILGELIIKEIPDTLGDATHTLSPDEGKRWKLIAGTIQIICDATVASRFIRGQILKGSDLLMAIGGSSTAITASQTKRINFHGFTLDDTWFYDDGGGTVVGSTNPQNVLIKDDWTISFKINAGVAGDVWSGRLVFLELEKY